MGDGGGGVWSLNQVKLIRYTIHCLDKLTSRIVR